MAAPVLDQRDLDFMLYELFEAESLTSRERYADHNRETFDAAINTARTMSMTEPGAGSGLADLTTSAVPMEDGSYRITGNKIFISGGDHEINENIVHLVLAVAPVSSVATPQVNKED